jgi:predicted alpha/beta-fold hydrolase
MWPLFGAILLALVLFALYYSYIVCKVPMVFYKPTEFNLAMHKHLTKFCDEPFRPLLYTLGNAHLQSVFNVLLRTPAQVSYRRDLVKLRDGGQLALDWALTDNDPVSSSLVLILTGYTGSSQELEIKILVQQLLDDGYLVAVIHFRGLGELRLSSKRFGDCPPQDIEDVILHVEKSFLQKHRNLEPLIAYGVSAGANCLTLYAGKSGKNCRFDALVSVSNPFDIHMALGVKLKSS